MPQLQIANPTFAGDLMAIVGEADLDEVQERQLAASCYRERLASSTSVDTRRRVAERGREETLVVDDRWRAVCFASGSPDGLCKGMLSPLDQLREICGQRRVMVGFDRGGSYPKPIGQRAQPRA